MDVKFYFSLMQIFQLLHFTREPAKNYKFTLDPFQSQSVLCIENDQSVLVSAHTR